MELEDILKKLEKIDIHCWDVITEKRGFDIINSILTTETNGLKFYLDEYCLSIKYLETDYSIIDHHYRYDKQYKKVIEEFYKKTYTALREYQKGKIEEKLENFLDE